MKLLQIQCWYFKKSPSVNILVNKSPNFLFKRKTKKNSKFSIKRRKENFVFQRGIHFYIRECRAAAATIKRKHQRYKSDRLSGRSYYTRAGDSPGLFCPLFSFRSAPVFAKFAPSRRIAPRKLVQPPRVSISICNGSLDNRQVTSAFANRKQTKQLASVRESAWKFPAPPPPPPPPPPPLIRRITNSTLIRSRILRF